MEKSLTSIGARQVDAQLKADFLLALSEKISQTDMFKWFMQVAAEYPKETFEFLESKTLSKHYENQPYIIARSRTTSLD